VFAEPKVDDKLRAGHIVGVELVERPLAELVLAKPGDICR
jgi:hypothetical protein